MRRFPSSAAMAALLLASAVPVVAHAQEIVRDYNIAAGPLDLALAAFAEQSGQQILYPATLVAGRRSRPLSGAYTADAALQAILKDTGLAYRRSRADVFVIYDPADRAAAEATAAEPTTMEEVVVTGSLIRGVVDGPSPVIVVSREDIDRGGHATVAQALAALPQNFGGTANEGALQNGADRTATNGTFASGVNLRGLGSDATLVLVNGRRMAGVGAMGDFADVSTLPTSAVERIDVLLDGASALYGPDVAEEIMSNCGVEVVFAPKELKVAQALSARLGDYTTPGRSRSRPAGLAPGRRSITVSDQRRPLMLPQELMQLPSDALLVLKAGAPPTRGRKIVYYREAMFRRRLAPPPRLSPSPSPELAAPSLAAGSEPDPMDFDAIVRRFAAEGLPPPAPGAGEDAIGAWLDRVVDATVPERDL